MSEPIVVAVTESASTVHAVEWAAARAAAHGARLLLLASSPEHGDTEAVPTARILLDAEEARIAQIAARLGIAIDVEARIVRGDLAHLLVEESEGAGMIVLGHDPAEHALARHVVSGAHCAVAVIPARDDTVRRGVVVGIDDSEVTEAAVAFAVDEAVRRGEPLIAASAWLPAPMPGDLTGSGDYLIGSADPAGLYPVDLAPVAADRIERALAPVRAAHPEVEVQTRVEETDAARLLTDLARDASVLIVGTHGRGALARFFLGSVSTAVLDDPASPTIAVR
ncbi:universal stress protein [Microbacterium aquimaris]|uniref:Universal stress protein n=1 Tax=Microbacterium aquimaris TaxID=459816 RepID=A0ABU5N501_9MICO|nr:universal stress protein [Microbacterium aquimaris]MDZ8161151.1 universal stress protein [Microbacterium aquimaris]